MTRLDKIVIFRDLPSDAIVRFEKTAIPLQPRTGAQLFTQGEEADSVYAITGGEGSVRVGSMDRRSKRLMVEVFGIGDVFGEIGVIDPGPRTANAVVDGRITLAKIPAKTFMAVLRDTPQLGLAVAVLLARRLRRTFELFEDAAFARLEVRLARQLLYLASMRGHSISEGAVLEGRLTQPELADLLGATSRSVISILTEWRRQGLIKYDGRRGRMIICNEAGLRRLVEE